MPNSNYEQKIPRHPHDELDPVMDPEFADEPEHYPPGLPPKPQFLQGKMTFLGLALAALGMFGKRHGIEIPAQETGDFITWLSANWEMLSAGIGILLAAYGRVRLNWRKP